VARGEFEWTNAGEQFKGGQILTLGHTVIEASHIFSKDFWSISRKPIMTDKHRLGILGVTMIAKLSCIPPVSRLP
jgi:hypothetical protein